MFLAELAASGGIAIDFLDLLLILRGESLVGFVGDDGEEIDFISFLRAFGLVNALAKLVAADAQAASEFLPLLDVAVGLVERGDVEDVGIVPADAERGMGKDEFNRVFKREQLILLAQDAVENLLVLEHGVFAVRVFIAAGLGEIVTLHGVNLARRRGCAMKLAVNGGVFLAEKSFDYAVVLHIAVHAINEDEREAFDAFRRENFLFLEVATDEPLQLLAKQAGEISGALRLDEFNAVGKF